MISAGSVYLWTNFKFKDSSQATKLVVVLGCSSERKICLIVRTTSQQSNKSLSPGCNLNDRFPNYFIPENQEGFPKDTWVMLDDYYEMDISVILSEKFQKNNIESKGRLSEDTLRNLIACVRQSEDISQNQLKYLL